MERRTFIRAVSAGATGGLVGLSGCSAPDGGGDGTTTEADTTTEATAEDGTTTTEGETTAEGETTTGQDGGGGTEQVRMVTEGSNYFFDPIGLFVEPGTTVEWVNESGSHSSTAYDESLDAADVTRIPDDAEPWDSGILTEEGATFSHTFETTGTYDYFCTPHKTLGMVARIVCGEPGDVEGDPPDGDVPAAQDIVDQGSISYEEFAGGGGGGGGGNGNNSSG